ncbi:MAG TPA: ISAs1 family transposase [Pseudonocardiaceae bacterium]|nr:ISAs1 family transposase [Pseudonocardiaceae bacterium]
MLSSQPAVDPGLEDAFPGLLELFAGVPESRKPRGLVFPLAFVLAASLIAVLGGAAYFRQIADQVADFPHDLLGKLGGRWCYFLSRFRTPCDRTFRRVFDCVDVQRLETEIGAWLRKRAGRDDDRVLRLAIDGKVLRGVWTDADERFTLFSAMIHREGVTIAQVKVPADTNEITQVAALLGPVATCEGERVIVTMDAAHTQHDTAEYIAGIRGFDYVMNAKGNQPTLHRAIAAITVPLVRNTPDHTAAERDHGRINTWETWITDADGINFPHARQTACIRRRTYDLAGQKTRQEYAFIITSLSAEDTTAVDLHDHVRNHWGIENKSHYVRDTTWHEDAQHTNNGTAPHVKATLTNTANSLLRLGGHTDIKRTTEWISRNPRRALTLLVTQRN